MQLDVGVEVVRPSARLAVHLRHQAVENPHSMTLLQQQIGQMRADEAGTAGDQYS